MRRSMFIPVTALLLLVGGRLSAELPANPVLHVAFDEGAGQVAKDDSGHPHHATIVNGRWIDGRFGKAVELSGTDSYVRIPFSDDFKIADAITISAWIRPAPPSLSGWHGIINAREKADGPYRVQLAQGRVEGGFALGNGWVRFASASPLEANQWRHIAVVYDSSSISAGTAKLISMYGERADLQWSDGVKIYIDGKLNMNQREAARASKGKIQFPPPEGIFIGHNYGQKDRFFTGAIDEVLIYSRALSDAEIEALYRNSPQEAMEKRVLADATSAKQWSAAESTLEASNARTRTGKDVLLWHVGVDHFTGEPNYPIGWPRIGLSLRDKQTRDWSDWDYLQMWIYTDTNREALPREPAGLSIQAPDKQGAYSQSLRELRKGQWVRIRIPLEQMTRRDDVRLIQFHISESNYRHLDKLDFYVDEVALLRYARPTLLDFALETAVAFADAKRLAVHFNVAGVKADEIAEVECELRQNGKTLARTAVKASRGPQRVVLDLSQSKLQSGEYQVLARVAGGADMPPLALRLVESPWQKAE